MDWGQILAYGLAALLVLVMGRALAAPIRIALALAWRGLLGVAALWATNLVGGFAGLSVAINPLSALVAGVLGLPGVLLLILINHLARTG